MCKIAEYINIYFGTTVLYLVPVEWQVYTIPTRVRRYWARPPNQLTEILQCEPPFLSSRATLRFWVATVMA